MKQPLQATPTLSPSDSKRLVLKVLGTTLTPARKVALQKAGYMAKQAFARGAAGTIN